MQPQPLQPLLKKLETKNRMSGLFSYDLIACKDEDVLRKALSQYNLNRQMGRHEDTALHIFVKTANEAGVKVCLELGSDLHLEDADDYTPLHVAAMKGFSTILEILLNDPRVSLTSPFRNNIPIRSLKCCKLLIDRGVRVELIAASAVPHIRIFEKERNKCRFKAILFMGTAGTIHRDVARLIGKHIWSMRMHVSLNV